MSEEGRERVKLTGSCSNLKKDLTDFRQSLVELKDLNPCRHLLNHFDESVGIFFMLTPISLLWLFMTLMTKPSGSKQTNQ